MPKRKIITIDERKCNGCGLCIPNCPEGAIQVIDKKARLISDLFCDGLGACIGHCPRGAINIEEREAAPYAEGKVMANIVKGGPNVIKAHLNHLKDHGEKGYLKQALDYLEKNNIRLELGSGCAANKGAGGCPGMASQVIKKSAPAKHAALHQESQLGQWPVQLRLVPAHAPYFNGADVLIAADCVPFAYADFHQELLKGKILLVGCPKLDDLALYREKLGQIFADNQIKSVTYAHMEVPCCFGLTPVIREAIEQSGRHIPLEEVTIKINGEKADVK